MSIQVKHITCVACLPDWNTNIIIIHTSKRTTKGSPYKFAFTSNDDLEDWVIYMNYIHFFINNLCFNVI